MRLAGSVIAIAIAIPVAMAAAAFPARAQVVSLDEGSFTLYRGNVRIGREDFSVRLAPSPGGPVMVAQATAAYGTRRIVPSVSADTAGQPSRYAREVRDSGRTVESYLGQVANGRFSSRLVHSDGESAREFRIPAGTVVADDDIVHHLWLIARRGAGASVAVLVPRRNTVETVRVEAAGRTPVVIDLRRFDTTRLLLQGPTGPPREVWVDDSGRIIKAVIPALGLTAVRD
ncbi:MAG: hypothetical protein FJ202_07395 [Gemmatimonadetes bacterium]|nr:hypothetical protein [Gemmatimonadota bacterium]